jgi:phospholipid transport system substrate-binding protein
MKKINIISLKWLGLLLLSWHLNAMAIGSPINMLQAVSNKMFSSMNHNLKTLKGRDGNRYLHKLVKKVLVPHVDVNLMSASVVGRNHWLKATTKQRRSFVRAFTKMVIITYSSALKSYTPGDKIRFYKIGNAYKKQKFIRVKSLLFRKSGQKIPITYSLKRSGSRWLIYDFSIEAVSISQSYRSQFSSILNSKGFPALLAKISKYNRNF